MDPPKEVIKHSTLIAASFNFNIINSELVYHIIRLFYREVAEERIEMQIRFYNGLFLYQWIHEARDFQWLKLQSQLNYLYGQLQW